MWGEGKRLAPFISPVQISVRTGPRLEPVLSSTSPPIHLSLKLSTLPSCPSSPGKPSRSCVAKFTAKILEIHCFFFPSLLGSPVQTRTASRSARFLSSSSVLRKGLPLPEIHPDAMHAQLCHSFLPRLCPGLVSQGTQSLQASAKGTAVPRLHPSNFKTHP